MINNIIQSSTINKYLIKYSRLFIKILNFFINQFNERGEFIAIPLYYNMDIYNINAK